MKDVTKHKISGRSEQGFDVSERTVARNIDGGQAKVLSNVEAHDSIDENDRSTTQIIEEKIILSCGHKYSENMNNIEVCQGCQRIFCGETDSCKLVACEVCHVRLCKADAYRALFSNSKWFCHAHRLGRLFFGG